MGQHCTLLLNSFLNSVTIQVTPPLFNSPFSIPRTSLLVPAEGRKQPIHTYTPIHNRLTPLTPNKQPNYNAALRLLHACRLEAFLPSDAFKQHFEWWLRKCRGFQQQDRQLVHWKAGVPSTVGGYVFIGCLEVV